MELLIFRAVLDEIRAGGFDAIRGSLPSNLFDSQFTRESQFVE